MCVKLTPISRRTYQGVSFDGHQFTIEPNRKDFDVRVRVRGGFETQTTKPFQSVFDMKAFCDELIREDRR